MYFSTKKEAYRKRPEALQWMWNIVFQMEWNGNVVTTLFIKERNICVYACICDGVKYISSNHTHYYHVTRVLSISKLAVNFSAYFFTASRWAPITITCAVMCHSLTIVNANQFFLWCRHNVNSNLKNTKKSSLRQMCKGIFNFFLVSLMFGPNFSSWSRK